MTREKRSEALPPPVSGGVPCLRGTSRKGEEGFPSIKISASDIRRSHEPGFAVDRPVGSGDFLFVYFHLPAKLYDVNGYNAVPANTCVVYAPNFKQLYAGDEVLDNTFIHFSGDGVADWMGYCGVPLNTAMSVGSFAELTPILRETINESLRREDRWEDAVSLLTSQFFLKLGRVVGHQFGPSAYHAELQERIRSVRATVHSSLNTKWTVPQMAALASMSPSRFAALYPEYFQSTPMDDLINSRLDHASFLLKQTTLTIERISELTGFSNPQHFNKMYRRRRGQSPGQCR